MSSLGTTSTNNIQTSPENDLLALNLSNLNKNTSVTQAVEIPAYQAYLHWHSIGNYSSMLWICLLQLQKLGK